MGRNLRARLEHIRTRRKEEAGTGLPVPAGAADRDPMVPGTFSDIPEALRLRGWRGAGFQCTKRRLVLGLPLQPVYPFPETLGIIIPDFFFYDPQSLDPGDLLFFDLETTGLSGGAGTVAFLAAFGRLCSQDSRPPQTGRKGPFSLEITQYLLLDYPGEYSFLEALLPEFEGYPFVISFNGKSFDCPLFRTRCLMNGMVHPAYRHGDLLHPARRLWKRVLPSCSQAEIESSILGIQREDDIPGAFAPDIWFDFLSHGETEKLLKICDHNTADILGLASLYSAMTAIAHAPLSAAGSFRCDPEQLAIRWREGLCRRARYIMGEGSGEAGFHGTAETLLSAAVDQGYPRARFLCARDLLKGGDPERGRDMLLQLREEDIPPALKARVYRSLAMDSEGRLQDPAEALMFTGEALMMEGLGECLRDDFLRRRSRLEHKLGGGPYR